MRVIKDPELVLTMREIREVVEFVSRAELTTDMVLTEDESTVVGGLRFVLSRYKDSLTSIEGK